MIGGERVTTVWAKRSRAKVRSECRRSSDDNRERVSYATRTKEPAFQLRIDAGSNTRERWTAPDGTVDFWEAKHAA